MGRGLSWMLSWLAMRQSSTSRKLSSDQDGTDRDSFLKAPQSGRASHSAELSRP